MPPTHKTIEPKGLLSLWVGFLAVVAVVTAGLLSPLAAHADSTPITKIGNITQNRSGDGMDIVISDGTNYLYDNNGSLECKSPDEADFDASKAKFTLSYASTSEGNRKNQSVTDNPAAINSADHYNAVGASGNRLVMGNEDNNTAGNVKLSLRSEAFLSATNVDYRVNNGGVFGTWYGTGKIYSDRFSSDGARQWFALNADSSTNQLRALGIETATTPASCGGTSGFTVYSATYTVTYKDYNGTVLQGPTTVEFGNPEPDAPANPTRDADDEYTYTFKEWVKSTDADGNITYTASYEATPKPASSTTTVVVTDEDGDPVVGATVTVKCGDDVVETYTIAEGDGDKVVTLPSDECVVKVDAPDGYEDPDDTPVNPGGDTEIIVKKSTYTVTYKDWNGDVLQGPDTVKVGDAEPAAPANPTRDADATNTYVFAEWLKDTDAGGNITYTARYDATPKPTTSIVVRDDDDNPVVGAKVTVVCGDDVVATYTIADGDVDKTVVLESGECKVQVDAPDGYEDPADTPAVPNGSTEITVERSTYTVTYVDWNDVVLQGPDTVKVGDAEPAAPADPTRPDSATHTYTFKEWVKSTDADGNVTYKADYTATAKPTTTIVVRDDDDNPVVGAKVTVVCGDDVVETYTIADGDGDKTVVLEPGECKVQVDAPDGYDDPTDTPVVPGGDTEITVKHSTHTVTYVDWDNTVLQGPDTVRDDQADPAAPANPTRAADATNTYTFKEWVKSTDADGNVTYKADYTATPKPTTTVIVNDEDGNPIAGATVTVVCDGKEVASYTTDGTENKTVVLEPGECVVKVDAPNGYDDPADKPAVPGGETEFTVEKTKQDVTVEIVDSKTGETLNGLVDVYDSDGAKVAESVNSGETVKLPAGDYTAKQSGDIAGYDKAGDKTFTVTDTAETVTLTAKSKPSEVTITVTDKENSPVDVTAEVNCDGVAQTITSKNGTVVFNADAGQCTVTFSADGYNDEIITVEVPGKGQNVEKSVEMSSKTATRPGSVDGKGNGNKNLNNAVPYNPAVKALAGDRGNGISTLSNTGGAVGIGLTVAVMLLLAGIFLLAKRRTEK